MKYRTMTLTLHVRVPATTGESEVQNAINAALDEPPCDWGDWLVGLVAVVDVTRAES